MEMKGHNISMGTQPETCNWGLDPLVQELHKHNHTIDGDLPNPRWADCESVKR